MSSFDVSFNKSLDEYRAGTLPTGVLFDLGRSPFFQITGWLSKVPIVAGQFVIRKIVDKHAADLRQFYNLPSRLESPLAIFESNTVRGSFVIVTNLMLSGKIVVAALAPNQNRLLGTYWDVRSIHAREITQLQFWEQKGLRRYLDLSRKCPWT